MLNCSFRLNSQPVSTLIVGGVGSFSAFSGNDGFKNKLSSQCLEDVGAIPLGKYYIFDRETGGRLGWLWDTFLDRDDWFALYAIDGDIDDKTLCEKVLRGGFRLHYGGRSNGCITVLDEAQYTLLYNQLKTHGASPVKGSTLKAYGIIEVTE